jgi:phosphoribosyl-AMP cyclohydrolase
MENFKYDEKGLIPAVIQDEKTGEVLMVAYMNEESLRKTLETGKTYFYSRSRKEIWLKGETSGHIQQVKSILTDCDKDTLVIKVDQQVAACHLGYRSCFVNRIDRSGKIVEVTQRRVFDPGSVYRATE